MSLTSPNAWQYFLTLQLVAVATPVTTGRMIGILGSADAALALLLGLSLQATVGMAAGAWLLKRDAPILAAIGVPALSCGAVVALLLGWRNA